MYVCYAVNCWCSDISTDTVIAPAETHYSVNWSVLDLDNTINIVTYLIGEGFVYAWTKKKNELGNLKSNL